MADSAFPVNALTQAELEELVADVDPSDGYAVVRKDTAGEISLYLKFIRNGEFVSDNLTGLSGKLVYCVPIENPEAEIQVELVHSLFDHVCGLVNAGADPAFLAARMRAFCQSVNRLDWNFSGRKLSSIGLTDDNDRQLVFSSEHSDLSVVWVQGVSIYVAKETSEVDGVVEDRSGS